MRITIENDGDKKVYDATCLVARIDKGKSGVTALVGVKIDCIVNAIGLFNDIMKELDPIEQAAFMSTVVKDLDEEVLEVLGAIDKYKEAGLVR